MTLVEEVVETSLFLSVFFIVFHFNIFSISVTHIFFSAVIVFFFLDFLMIDPVKLLKPEPR